MALALIYDPRTKTFDEWAQLMVEAYGGQNLEIPDDEEDWKSWAVGLTGIDIFVNEAIPNPYIFENWEDWAEELVGAINQNVNQVNQNG